MSIYSKNDPVYGPIINVDVVKCQNNLCYTRLQNEEYIEFGCYRKVELDD
jgi:hypothetical protein